MAQAIDRRGKEAVITHHGHKLSTLFINNVLSHNTGNIPWLY